MFFSTGYLISYLLLHSLDQWFLMRMILLPRGYYENLVVTMTGCHFGIWEVIARDSRHLQCYAQYYTMKKCLTLHMTFKYPNRKTCLKLSLEANSILRIDTKYFCMILTYMEIINNTIVWVNCLEHDILSCLKRKDTDGNTVCVIWTVNTTSLSRICIWSYHIHSDPACRYEYLSSFFPLNNYCWAFTSWKMYYFIMFFSFILKHSSDFFKVCE